ncbi:uncharacterized protein [Typha angustifolia]|uniref:uncharacterized protein isoform X3 n=1 Tax=Typha angustifolia TaxID=59011 RepID=UPI003C2EE91E
MANCGYHSPQLSEDAAWLPPWLQPHQLPTFRDHAGDNGSISLLPSEGVSFFEENMHEKQSGHCSTRNDAGYSSFCLYLSGDGNSPNGNTPSSGNALNFSLHLSSSGASQLSSGQANDRPQMIKFDNEGSSGGLFIEALAVQNNENFLHEVENGAPESDESLGGCKPPIKTILQPLGKTEKNSGQKFLGEVDPRKLKAGIGDAVELSIAASEAIVIAEMVCHSLHSDSLPAAAILEAALRLKQARNQFFLNDTEADSTFVDHEVDETNLLLELDENSMSDAFRDVGLSFPQSIQSSDNSFHGGLSSDDAVSSDPKHYQNSNTSSLPHLGTYVPESFCMETQNGNLRTQDTDYIGNISPANHGASSKPLEDLPPLFTSMNQVKSSSSQPFANSCSGNEYIALTPNLTQNAHALTGIKDDMEEIHDIIEGGEFNLQGDATTKKHIREVFDQETSFISESMYSTEGCPLAQKIEADNEIIASSSTPISLNEVLTDDGVNKNVAGEDGKSFINPEKAEDQMLNGDALSVLQQESQSPKSLVQKEKSIRPKVIAGSSGLPRRKKFNSLKPYSTITPALDIIGNGVIPYKSVASINTATKIRDIVPSEGNTNDFEHNDEESNGLSAFAETKDNDTAFVVPQHKSFSTLVFNNKKRRIQACNMISSIDVEDNSLKGLLALEKNKYKNSTSKPRRGNLTKILSNVPLQTTLPSIPSDKLVIQKKRVQFLEAEHNIRNAKISRQKSNSSQCRTSKRKESSLKKRSGNGKGKSNILKSCSRSNAEEMIFQGIEFLLTGFASHKEKELEVLIRKFGGYILHKVPACPSNIRGELMKSASWKPPIILSPKKVSTNKFLYGCATGAWMLNAHWLVDSLRAGSLLTPWKYLTRPTQAFRESRLRIGEPLCLDHRSFIFDGVGILLNGKVSFCSKFSNIIKHGGGQVFTSIQQLVQSLKVGNTIQGAILVENEASVSRHLKHCGLEYNIQTIPASWIIDVLFSGKLVPFKKDTFSPLHGIKITTFPQEQPIDMTQEI